MLSYDKLLVATGSSARKLRIPGADLPEVVTIRAAQDAAKVLDTCATATDVVIVGAGFIGLETAVTLLGKFPVRAHKHTHTHTHTSVHTFVEHCSTKAPT